MRFIDISDQVFGRWHVDSYAGNSMWNCTCDCGRTKQVSGSHLRGGVSRSCHSCAPKAIKHGQASSQRRTKKYKVWLGIKNRVLNPRNKDFPRYSRLGLHPAWRDYSIFDAEVPNPPHDSSTIDRIDTNKGYVPGNVRWVTQQEQCRNREGNVWIEFGGHRKLQSDWASELHTDSSTLRRQIARFGVIAAFAKHGRLA